MTTATDMAAALAAGRTTARALADAALAGIAARDRGVRAFVTVDAAGARAAAVASDARRAAGRVIGPLDGIPVAVKDNIAVAGLPRHGGTGAFPDPVPADATVTARLRAAGAVILGTLNMHEGALGATTDNPFWGRCDNPAAPGHVPGGSSGGSGAAVAAGFVPLALGTDTMGSVRIPAAYCGCWGLKPTRGAIPVTGLLHLSWTLDSIGPIAGSAGDLALALDVLAGFDAADPQSVDTALPDDLPDALVLAVPDAALLATCEPEVRAAHDRAVAAARALGARIVPLTLDWDPGRLRRAGLLVSEAEGAVVLGDTIAATPHLFSDRFRAAIAYGAGAAAARLALAYRRIAETAALTHRALRGVDAVLMPAAPQRAFRHGDPVPADQADFTALANVAGLPALVFPLPAADGDPPLSVQLMGPAFADRRLIALGQALCHRIPA